MYTSTDARRVASCSWIFGWCDVLLPLCIKSIMWLWSCEWPPLMNWEILKAIFREGGSINQTEIKLQLFSTGSGWGQILPMTYMLCGVILMDWVVSESAWSVVISSLVSESDWSVVISFYHHCQAPDVMVVLWMTSTHELAAIFYENADADPRISWLRSKFCPRLTLTCCEV